MTTRYTRGVWSLENVENKFPDDDWVEITNVFTRTATEHAYFAGGMDNSYNFKSDYDKLTYATDTTENVPSSNFGTPGSRYISATNSTTAGYHNHGLNPGNQPLTNVSKYTFASDSSSQLPSSGFIRQVSGDKPYALFSVGTNTNGYFISGQPGPRTSCHKLVYSTDQCDTLPSGDASLARSRGMSVGTQTVGLLAGGYRYELPGPNQITSTIDKLTYSNETTAASPSTFPASRYSSAPYNNSTAGYFTGGRVGSSETKVSSTTKIIFSSDAISNVPGLNATIVRYKFTGIGGTKGFIGGGLKSDGSTNVSTVDKINLTTETAALSPSGQLTDERRAAGCFGPQGNAMPGSLFDPKRWIDGLPEPPNTAYATRGTSSGGSPVYKTDLSTLTAFSYLAPATQSPQRSRQGTFSSGLAAYLNGGGTGVPQSSMVSNQDKLTYSTDTTARLPSSNTPVVLLGHNGVANETVGWFWGGNTYGIPEPYNQTNLYKTTFSTDAMSTSPANMTAGNYYMSSTNSATAGYTFSGQTYSTNTQKLTFSTESCSMLPAQVPSAIYNNGSAIGNQTAGYVNAGHPAYSAIVKTVWATETSSEVASITSPGRSKTLCFGNTTLGFWGGGTPGPAAAVDQITYATDTVANVPSLEPSAIGGPGEFGWGEGGRSRGIPVPLASNNLTPTASTMSKYPATLPNFGFQQGHSSAPSGDEVRKIDFATEVGSEIPARLPNARKDHCSFSSNLASYISGGSTPSTTNSSQIDKTVYATGTSSRVVNGSSDYLEPGRNKSGAAGNQTNGWTMGGGPAYSRIDKFFYSSETNQGDGYWSNDGPGPNGRRWQSTLSAPEYIYAAGGGSRSSFWRFSYSIGSQQELPATLLRPPGNPTSFGAEGQIPGLGNLTQGYVGGGNNPGGSPGNPYLQKLVYSTETVSSLGEILTGARYGVSNCGNLETGYFLGGSPSNAGPNAGKTMKLSYSSETLSVCPAADTASQKQRGHGSGAKSFGIWTDSFPVII